jgi:hypothetical protein
MVWAMRSARSGSVAASASATLLSAEDFEDSAFEDSLVMFHYPADIELACALKELHQLP